MNTPTRLFAIFAGYVLAFALAGGVVALYVAATDSPERQASAGMAAFGEAALFIVVFAVAAIAPTAIALRALAACAWCWALLSVVALITAGSALACQFAFVGWRASGTDTWLGTLAMLAPVRMLFTPLLGLLFLVATLCAPIHRARIALALATLAEGAAFAGFVWVLAGST